MNKEEKEEAIKILRMLANSIENDDVILKKTKETLSKVYKRTYKLEFIIKKEIEELKKN